MSEEKKAIEIVKNIEFKDLLDSWDAKENYDAIQVVLNLIEKQDKIIDLMADEINLQDIDESICSKVEEKICDEVELGRCSICIKEYFRKKVGNERKEE